MRVGRGIATGILTLTMVWASHAAAQNVTAKGSETISINGFIGATIYAQDDSFAFGNGQSALFPTNDSQDDPWFIDGDIRHTRVTLTMQALKGENWSNSGVLELDFFGGYNGGGAFSDEQPIPRLRLAYADFVYGNTRLRLGQAWSPLLGNVPVSLTHVAFPLGYGSAGLIGWRFPGLFVYHTINDMIEVQFAAMRGSWDDGAGAATTTAGNNAAASSMIPQLQARVNVKGKIGDDMKWSAYVVGHYDRKDLSGTGDATENNLDGYAAQFGAKVEAKLFMVQGNIYYGHAIGQNFGNLTQFGDISGWGGWLQVGVNPTDKFSAFLFAGMADPKNSDLDPAVFGVDTRVKGTTIAALLRYKLGSAFIGLEYTHGESEKRLLAGGKNIVVGNQIALSAMYKF